MKTTHLGVLFKKQSTIFLYRHRFSPETWQKSAYMEISINCPSTNFVEYYWLDSWYLRHLSARISIVISVTLRLWFFFNRLKRSTRETEQSVLTTSALSVRIWYPAWGEILSESWWWFIPQPVTFVVSHHNMTEMSWKGIITSYHPSTITVLIWLTLLRLVDPYSYKWTSQCHFRGVWCTFLFWFDFE